MSECLCETQRVCECLCESVKVLVGDVYSPAPGTEGLVRESGHVSLRKFAAGRIVCTPWANEYLLYYLATLATAFRHLHA